MSLKHLLNNSTSKIKMVKKVTASKLDKGDLPTLFNKNKNVEDATDDFGKLEADDYKTVSLFFEVNNDESYNSILNQKMRKQRDKQFLLA